MSRTGTSLFSAGTNVDDPLTVYLVHRTTTAEVPETLQQSSGTRAVRIRRSYAPQGVDLRAVGDFSEVMRRVGIAWPSGEFGTIALLLRLATEMVTRRDEIRLSAAQFGYISIDYDELLDALPRWWSDTTNALDRLVPGIPLPKGPTELCERLSALPASIVPVRNGPVLRIDGDLALLDLASAAAALEHTLELGLTEQSSQGQQANVRATHFELVVQRLIDRSSWAPSAAMRTYRGKTLKLNGNDVSDVDAIAIQGATLLLVSAKSIAYTRRHDEGEYAAARNAATTVEQACLHARALADSLTKNRKGDNYDFSDYTSIDVVVCVPYPIYTRLGPATVTLSEGLLAAVTLNELGTFLRAKKPD